MYLTRTMMILNFISCWIVWKLPMQMVKVRWMRINGKQQVSHFPLFYLFSTPDPVLLLVLGDGEGGVRHGVFVLGYHSSAFFAVYPHQSSSPALPSRDPVVAPRSWSSLASMSLPPAPPCTVHVIALGSGWFSVSEPPSFIHDSYAWTYGEYEIRCLPFFLLPLSIRSFSVFHFFLCHILLHPHPNITPCPLFDLLIPPHIAYNDTLFFSN